MECGQKICRYRIRAASMMTLMHEHEMFEADQDVDTQKYEPLREIVQRQD